MSPEMRRAAGVVVGAIVSLAFATLWFVYDRDRERKEKEERYAQVSAYVLGAYPEWPDARIVSINDQFRFFCGWVDGGPNEGSLPFFVLYSDDPGDPVAFAYTPRPHLGDAQQRARGSFAKAMVLRSCEPNPLPPAPADALVDHVVDDALSRVILPGNQGWAIVPARGEEGYLAVSGPIEAKPVISPVFSTSEEALLWTRNEGKRRVEEAKAIRAQRNACLERAREEQMSEDKCWSN